MSSVLPRPVEAGPPLSTQLALGALAAGFLLLLVPTVMALMRQVWHTDE